MLYECASCGKRFWWSNTYYAHVEGEAFFRALAAAEAK